MVTALDILESNIEIPAEQLLNWLQDDRFFEAIKKFLGDTEQQTAEVFRLMMTVKRVADHDHVFAAAQVEAKAEINKVLDSFSTISSYFDKFIGAPQNDDLLQKQVDSHRAAIGAARSFCEDVSKVAEKISLLRSSSQKTQKTEMSFAVLFYRSLTKTIVRPDYEAVATIASVLYNTPDEISVDAVRKAVVRDLKRRKI